MTAQEGRKAPPFTLEDQDGARVSLRDFAGRWVVLYFYPKDDTPGCTTEACDFRDGHADFEAAGATVLGVSPDPAKRHLGFIAKHGLPFRLLVDDTHAVAEKYGAWGEKTLYGKKYEGLIRSTFLIGPDGVLLKAWRKVKVAGHVDEVRRALEAARR